MDFTVTFIKKERLFNPDVYGYGSEFLAVKDAEERVNSKEFDSALLYIDGIAKRTYQNGGWKECE